MMVLGPDIHYFINPHNKPREVGYDYQFFIDVNNEVRRKIEQLKIASLASMAEDWFSNPVYGWL